MARKGRKTRRGGGWFDWLTGKTDETAGPTGIASVDSTAQSIGEKVADATGQVAEAVAPGSTAPVPGASPVGGRRRGKKGRKTRRHRKVMKW
jgi:hypothetical protein